MRRMAGRSTSLLGDEDDTVLSVPREGRRKMPILAGHVLMKEKNVYGELPVDRR